MRKKFAITYATVYGLLNNSEIRTISPIIKAAYDSIETETAGQACSACAKKKRTNEAITKLIEQLQGSSDLELDRIKKALGVNILIFPNGMSFMER
jgi:hypothetical protein